MPPQGLFALVGKYGLATVLVLVYSWWMLTTLTGRMDALVAEQKVTNVRLMALCAELAGADPSKVMTCMATSTTK